MQKIYYTLLCCLLCTASSLLAQDPVYSQFYAAPLQLNPAFAGNTYAPFIAINHRRQWPSIDNAYVTSSVSYDQFVKAINSGFGFGLSSDNAGNGIYRKSVANLYYAYRLQLNKKLSIKFGIEGGLMQTRLDWDKLVFFDQLDAYGVNPNTPTNEIRPAALNRSVFDIGTGILVYNNRFYGGFSVKHLNTPDESLLQTNSNLNSGLPLRFSLHAGTQIPITKGTRKRPGIYVSPNILFTKQGPYWQLNSGVYGGAGMVFFGMWYRHAGNNSDAAIVNIGVRKGVFKIGYSFDATMSRLNQTGTGGSHEISVNLNFDALNQRKKIDYNDCFQIFR